MSANVWQPGSEVVNVDAESTMLSQVFVATDSQTVFNLTQFSYTPNTGSISVYRNGQKLIKGTDYTETDTDTVTFTGISIAAGELIEIQGIIGSTGANVILAEAAAVLAANSAAAAAASAASIDVSTLLAKSANLSDVADPAAARGNLGAQAQLVSGTNIKTVNGQSLVGSGDISISTSVPDGDKGDIIVSGGGTVWTLDPSVVSHPLTSGTAINTTSGTAHDFTGIPSWVKRITLMLSGVSTNSTGPLLLQLGSAGGVEATGYVGMVSLCHSSGVNTFTGVTTGAALVHNTMQAADTCYGSVILTNISGNTWVISGEIFSTSSLYQLTPVSGKTLSGVLSRIRLTTLNGTDLFDAGQINILYE